MKAKVQSSIVILLAYTIYDGSANVTFLSLEFTVPSASQTILYSLPICIFSTSTQPLITFFWNLTLLPLPADWRAHGSTVNQPDTSALKAPIFVHSTGTVMAYFHAIYILSHNNGNSLNNTLIWHFQITGDFISICFSWLLWQAGSILQISYDYSRAWKRLFSTHFLSLFSSLISFYAEWPLQV